MFKSISGITALALLLCSVIHSNVMAADSTSDSAKSKEGAQALIKSTGSGGDHMPRANGGKSNCTGIGNMLDTNGIATNSTGRDGEVAIEANGGFTEGN